MENIYDKVNELAEALKKDPNVVAYREATKKVNKNPKIKKMVENFRKIQFQAYSEQVQTGIVSPETQEQMRKFGELMTSNPEVSNYISSEASFAAIWDGILKTLNDAIGVNIIAPAQE